MESNTAEFAFTDFELNEVQKHLEKYPDPRSAVMPVLWMAQEKFGWLSEGAMELVARTIGMPYAHVYGVASFYTMYFKKPVPKYLFDICTCFTCGEMGGDDMLAYAKEYLNTDENGHSEDGMFWVRPAECLGACDTAPMMQIQNGHYAHNLTQEKMGEIIEDIRSGSMPGFVSIPLSDQKQFANGAAPATPAPAPQPEAPAAESTPTEETNNPAKEEE